MQISSIYKHHSVDGILFTQPTMTQQHMKDETDINLMMRRYQQTGLIPQYEGATYGDFSQEFDYRQAYDMIIDAEERFGSSRLNYALDLITTLAPFSTSFTMKNYDEAVTRLDQQKGRNTYGPNGSRPCHGTAGRAFSTVRYLM